MWYDVHVCGVFGRIEMHVFLEMRILMLWRWFRKWSLLLGIAVWAVTYIVYYN